MKPVPDRTPGVNFEVEDLVRVRGRLAGLSLKNLSRPTSYRSGARETRVRGRGMEYEESRAYISGDDMRTMDWRVMARTGEAHTKVFAEEKERRFLLAVDLSPSMFFGTRFSFKSWAAAHTCAHLGWLASFAGDRLGGVIAAPETKYEIRPGKTRSGLMGVFHHLAEAGSLERIPDTGVNRLNFLLRELQRVVKPGSIIALISDFIGIDEDSPELLSTLVKHNDLNAFWIHDDTEVEPWPSGLYPVRVERKEFEFDLSRTAALSWLEQRQQQHRAQLDYLTNRFSIPLFPISCNREITPQILEARNT